MARLNVNLTRMVMSQLKGSSRWLSGHKLMKDKRRTMRIFLELAREIKALRESGQCLKRCMEAFQ